MAATHEVPSTNGVTVALHDLGGDGPALLMCHPTGFHGMTWLPVAEELATVARCWAPDLRGHGDTTPPDDGDYAWRGMAEDVLAVVDRVGRPPGGLLAVGHSMGGGALVLAELARPGTFAALWLYEPIVIPPPEGGRAGPNPMSEAARRRRPSFPDRDAAYANYAAKPPLDTLTPAALRAYVDHGFRDRPDLGVVELKCTPEIEAQVFQGSASSGAFEGLDALGCPVTIAVSGDGGIPAQLAPLVVESLPRGRLERHPQLSHFGPMEGPATIAAAIRTALGLGSPSASRQVDGRHR